MLVISLSCQTIKTSSCSPVCSRSGAAFSSGDWDSHHSQGLTSLLAFDARLSRKPRAYDRSLGSNSAWRLRLWYDDWWLGKNDNLGMVDGKIVVSNPDMLTALKETLSKMLNEDSEYCLSSISVRMESEELASSLLKIWWNNLRCRWWNSSGQTVHPYIFSVG